jgi:hypothetical protein
MGLITEWAWGAFCKIEFFFFLEKGFVFEIEGFEIDFAIFGGEGGEGIHGANINNILEIQ